MIIYNMSNTVDYLELFERRYLKGGYIEDGQVVFAKDISSGRFALWSNAIRDFWRQPIFGQGLGYVSDVYYLSLALTPHNTFIELLVMLGIFGFIPFVLILYWIGKLNIVFLRHSKDRNSIIVIITLIAFFIAHVIGQSVSTMMTRRPHQEMLFYLLIGVNVKYILVSLRDNCRIIQN